MDSVGRKIRELRKIRKLTQEQLVERCGVSPSCISRWENDVLRPTAKNIESLSTALSANITELFPSYAVQPSESLIVREIVSIVEQMTEPEQKFVLETLIHYQEVRNSLTKDSIT